MYIKRATKDDIPAIKALISKQAKKVPFFESMINKSDIAYQVRTEDGTLIAFLYCGLMANKKIAYIDSLVVDPEYKNQKVAARLALHIHQELRARKIDRCSAFSMQDSEQRKLFSSLEKLSAYTKEVPTVSGGVLIEWFKV
jgi:N-acetylglutamate synthase-like GNAT family acetyltransferase